MASTNQSGSSLIVGINVTPLVDIMLVLLIIFMVTAKIVDTPAVPLDLPRSSHTEELPVVLSIIVPVAGPMLVNGETMTDDSALVRRTQEAVLKDSDVRVVIAADGGVLHRRVIHILDLIKGAGITRIAFGALPSEERAQ